MPTALPEKSLTTTLKVFVFIVLAWFGGWLSSWVLLPAGYLIQSALSVFFGALAANAIAIRIYEGGRLVDVGFAWSTASMRNLGIGLAGGVASAAIVLGVPLIFGLAEFAKSESQGAAALVFVSVVLLFGASGEEMLFHGYAFQVLLRTLGPFATILPVSVVFAAMHSMNLNVSVLALINTGLWGVLFGYAFWRSGDLWLPIGLHFGWNWALPLFGVNLSGFTINVTGHAMRWKIAPLWSGGDYGPEGGLLTCGILIVLFLFIWKAPIERQTPLLLRGLRED